jgi:hypothetical protein
VVLDVSGLHICMDEITTPRWQHSKNLQDWTNAQHWTFGVTVQPSVSGYTRSQVVELSHRQHRIIERTLWGEIPPTHLVAVSLVEQAPEDGVWHSHWLIAAHKEREQKRFEDEGVWRLAKSCLAYQTRLPNAVLNERRQCFVRTPADGGGTVLTIPRTIRAPSIHWFAMDEIGAARWQRYINKMRVGDPEGDRFVFGRTVR